MIRMNRYQLAVFLITAFAFMSFLCASSLSQNRQRKFTPGEIVETGGGINAKILRCRGTGNDEECEVQYYRGDAPESTPRWENASFLRTAEERVLNYKKQNGVEPAKDQTQTAAEPQRVIPTEIGVIADCSFVAPSGDVSNTAKPSEGLFKRKIYDLYNVSVNGTGSAPLKIGVSFLNFAMKTPFTNVVHVVPGVGARRINDAAPPNATIYPVISKHIVCEQYRDSTLRRQIENKYACFKNRDGDWVCGADGVPKITQLSDKL